jgi:hypothetical protein
MNLKRPEADDPMMLVGVSVPVDRDSVREMAATFAEEFAALGYGEDRLLNLFREPFYSGAHRAYQVLGEVEIRRIVREARGFWGGHRVTIRDAEPAALGHGDLVQIGKEDADEEA